MSFSAFYSHMEKTIKKPCRLSDLCEYCELGKDLKIQVEQAALETGYFNNTEEEFSSDDLLSHFRNIENR